MENAESLFSGLSDSLKANFIPIVVVLVLVLFILGWLVYNSFTGSSKNNDTKPEEVEVEQPTQVVEQHEQSEQADEDEKSSE